jgi:hypothetical protein
MKSKPRKRRDAMRRFLTTAAIMLLALMTSGCGTRTFMVYKDGNNFFITRDCAERHRLLCDSGDIDRVVVGSGLPGPLQLRITKAICSTDTAKSDMQVILQELTDEQLASLKKAFSTSGYEINKPADT